MNEIAWKTLSHTARIFSGKHLYLSGVLNQFIDAGLETFNDEMKVILAHGSAEAMGRTGGHTI